MDIQPWAADILREPTKPTLTRPSPLEIEACIMAMEGAAISEVRSAHPSLTVKLVGNSVRKMVTAMRMGRCPAILAERYPEVLKEQQEIRKQEMEPVKVEGSGFLGSLLDRLGQILVAPSKVPKGEKFKNWARQQKEQAGAVLVPMTLRAMGEGIARGDVGVLRMAAESYDLAGGKRGGPLVAQQFNMGELQRRIGAKGNYFEKRLREVRKRAGLTAPALPPPSAAVEADAIDAEEAE